MLARQAVPPGIPGWQPALGVVLVPTRSAPVALAAHHTALTIFLVALGLAFLCALALPGKLPPARPR